MGALINAYAPRLEKEKKLFFITLTSECSSREPSPGNRGVSEPLAQDTYIPGGLRMQRKRRYDRYQKLECTYHANKVKLEKHEEWKVNLEGKMYKKVWFTPTSEPDEWFDTYHPHLHVLVSDEQTAINIKEKWLELNPDANPGAQSSTVTDKKKKDKDGNEKVSKGYLEIFKYFTKLIAKDSDGHRFFDAQHMNTILKR